MPIIQVLLEVPQEIVKGIDSGQYVREAAGIIRWAKGTDRAGEIVAHLREISETGWQGLQPLAALMLFQLGGFIYLGYQLKQIRQFIESLTQNMEKIRKLVEEIREQQWLDPLKRIAHGVEQLMSSQFRPVLLEEARNSFIKARGEIKFFLDDKAPMTLIEYLPQTKKLAEGLWVGLAGEYTCLNRQRAKFSEMEHVCERYSDIFSEIRQKIDDAPPISRIIPSHRYLTNYRQRGQLSKELNTVHEMILGEKEFIKVLDRVETEQIEALQKSLPSDSDKAVLLVYP